MSCQSLFGNGMSSRLNLALREVYALYSYNTAHDALCCIRRIETLNVIWRDQDVL